MLVLGSKVAVEQAGNAVQRETALVNALLPRPLNALFRLAEPVVVEVVVERPFLAGVGRNLHGGKIVGCFRSQDDLILVCRQRVEPVIERPAQRMERIVQFFKRFVISQPRNGRCSRFVVLSIAAIDHFKPVDAALRKRICNLSGLFGGGKHFFALAKEPGLFIRAQHLNAHRCFRLQTALCQHAGLFEDGAVFHRHAVVMRFVTGEHI
ncbi:hypothetical protein SDC9_86245 [bioreactor metagenome]|uniref:Uncharacterized protein n=1 Tax=bioreactor metagenome TaxID=1076179 RepID=A0A644ZIG0_9ZZZZ